MRLIEPSKAPKQKLLNETQSSSWIFVVLRSGVGLAALGAIGFMLPFLLRTTLTASGRPWKEVQTWGLMLVFTGGVLFVLAALHFKIDVSLLTFDRLLAIIRNEVYVPPSEREQVQRYVRSALSSLDDKWSLYPDVKLDSSGGPLPFAMLGPAGVFGLDLNAADPRKRSYADPAPRLAASCGTLQRRLATKVTPVLLFSRHESHYNGTTSRVKAFSSAQLIAWLASASRSPESCRAQGNRLGD